MSEDFYVNIENPVELRRKLLEASKDVVMALQKFEKFKLNRVKTLEYHERLRRNAKEINDLIAALKKELPAAKLPRIEQPRIAAPKVKKIVAAAPQPKPEPKKAAAEKLEQELAEIESKLKALQ